MTLRGVPRPASARDYWDDVAHLRGRDGSTILARRYSDAVNAALLDRWWPASEVGSALKTDLFDEACSDGLLPLLLGRAPRVFGIDISGRTAAAARAGNPRAHVVESEVRQLPFAGGSFGLVVSNSTLDHFDSPVEIDRSLAELHRVLRSGGTLILTLDNPAHPILALRRAFPALWRRLGLVPYEVGASLGPRALRAALGRAGFRVEEVAAVMHFPRVAVALLEDSARGDRRDASKGVGVAGPPVGDPSVRRLMRWESLCRWPTRWLTGHFVAARATRP